MRKQLLFIFLFIAFLTQAQVSLVKDIRVGNQPGLNNSLEDAAVINNQLIFTASSSVSSWRNVWISDGTSSGTVVLHELSTSGVGGYAEGYYYSTALNKVIFLGNNESGGGFGVFTTDGTSTGLTELNAATFSYVNQYPPEFTDFNGSVIFNYADQGSNIGYELYITDGTPSGTVVLKKTRANSVFGGIPADFTELNGMLFFTARDPNNGGRELWVTDGTTAGTNLLVDINPGSTDANPEDLVVFNNKIYFTADDGVNGRELWVTDGTASGTQMVQDLLAGGSSDPKELTVYNNFLIFTANNASTGIEAFKMTTSENITNLKNINPGTANSAPFGYTVFNGELYFAADNGSGVELWKSGGFPANTNLLADINPSGESTPQGFTAYNGKLYFNADDGVNGRELWVTDGTSSGTQLVEDIRTGGASSEPLNFIVVGDDLFFSANNGSSGAELFKYRDPVLSVQDQEVLEFIVEMYPNPASSEFRIATQERIDRVEIVALNGQTIKTFKTAQESYEIENLSNGIYIARIVSGENTIIKKLIKK